MPYIAITTYLLIAAVALIAVHAGSLIDEDVEESSQSLFARQCSIDDVEHCKEKEVRPTETEKDTCSLYLAPSSIQNSGYGIFTTRSYKMNEEIFCCRSPSVIVTEKELHSNATWLIADYMWHTFGAGAYEASTADTWEPTPLGSLGNYHPFLTNYAPFGNTQRYDDTLAD